ncbi:hypothetical protein FA13DRAFT_1806698 [Coprinellus micaceus]|uniref:Uncharacterized protein n=1 Tax=Coprinellus micaceus TaxID=71717 RepID=A0A4Y7RJV5_COPMI|nr:hypothetical protein FA13DRAFT_1806698 [Coprinellus micaceus]
MTTKTSMRVTSRFGDGDEDFDDFYASDNNTSLSATDPTHLTHNPSHRQDSPLTPPGFDHQRANVPAEDEFDNNNDNESPGPGPTPSRTPKGPISQKVKDEIEGGFSRIDNVFFEMEKKTGRSVENLMLRYRNAFSPRQNSTNSWNLYQVKFSQDRENQRKLAGSDSATCREAYQAYIARHPTNFQSLLETFAETCDIEKLFGTTVGQRKAEFKKFTTIVSTLCERFYKRQGFEVAVMGVGNIVNADGNLQFCYETPGVEGFLETLPIRYNALIACLRTRAFASEVKRIMDLIGKSLAEKDPHLLAAVDISAFITRTLTSL